MTVNYVHKIIYYFNNKNLNIHNIKNIYHRKDMLNNTRIVLSVSTT